LYPTTSNLPGTDTFKGVKDENALRELVQQWEEQDKPKWTGARAQLRKAVRSDEVPAFNTAGKIGQEFWLTHDLNSPEAQHVRFRRADLMRLLHRSEVGADAWTPAAELFSALETRGIADPIRRVTQLLRSGELAAWLGNDADAATAWRPIETRLFVLGMTIHRSGKLTKDDVPREKYAALTNVPTGAVWFSTEDLQRTGLMAAADTPWRCIRNPRWMAWLARFKERQQHEKRWIRSLDLAEWYTRQRGAITTAEAEALHDEACQQLFRSLLAGDFVDLRGNPKAMPHLMTTAGFSRMSPEHVEFFRGTHWAGSRDRDGEPILASGLLRELMRDVWLPARLIADWCRFRNIGLPPWLPTQPAGIERSADKAHPLLPTGQLLKLWPGHEVTIPVTPSQAVPGEQSLEGIKQCKPPIAPAELALWYEARRDDWPNDRKHPSEAEDLTDARDCYPDHHITREAMRTVRARLAPKTWTSHGRRKHARK
jgi:hypothetical protein